VQTDPGTEPSERAELEPGSRPQGLLPLTGGRGRTGSQSFDGFEGSAREGNGTLVGPAGDSPVERAEDVPASLRAFVRRYLRSIRGEESQ
jgi:hypothetical protein